MQIWYDSGTNEVKAVYSGRYTGTVWGDAGCDVYRDSAPLPRSMMPGAILEFDLEGKPQVKTPAPPPAAPPRTRLDDLRDKLKDDSITEAEIREFMRLERGL